MTAQLIAVRMPPGPRMLTVLDGVWQDGDAVLPLRPDLPDGLMARLLERLRPTAVVDAPDGRDSRPEMLADAEPVAAGTALVIVTSGSTGRPKGVVLGHAALRAMTRASIDRLGCRRGERWLACLPFDHVAGLACVLRSRELGTEPEVHARFDAAAVADTDAAHVSLVPTQLVRLLDAGLDPSRFRTILLGGAAADRDLLDRAAASGARVVRSYGMTETCGGCVYDGRPLDGVEVRLGERADGGATGRIRLRGPMLMSGYRNDPELTAASLEDGWLTTSDLGRLTADGRLEVVGRVDEVVVTGGENVAVAAVAARLRAHPAVADVAVSGRPDPEWGQRLVAVVVPVTEGTPPTLAQLREHAAAELPRHALPRELVLVGALPRDRMGKVSRDTLAAMLSARDPSTSAGRSRRG